MKRKRVFAVFLAVVVLLSLTVTAFGGNSDEDHKSVKVAFVEQEGLMEKDEDGNLSGYSYDYIMKMAQYANWDVEFVFPTTDSLDGAIVEMMDKVEKGQVDMISGLVYNEALADMYAYPEKGYGYAFTTLLASKTNTAINGDNLALRKNLKVAVMDMAIPEMKS